MKNDWAIDKIKSLEKSKKYVTLVLKFNNGIIVNARLEESLEIPEYEKKHGELSN